MFNDLHMFDEAELWADADGAADAGEDSSADGPQLAAGAVDTLVQVWGIAASLADGSPPLRCVT